MNAIALFVVAWTLAGDAWAGPIKAADAKKFIGKQAVVCGTVVSANYAAAVDKQPTFLNIDKAYPEHVFTALIWGADRKKFGEPEKSFANKRVCVKGKVEEFKGIPQIVVKDKKQLVLQGKAEVLQ